MKTDMSHHTDTQGTNYTVQHIMNELFGVDSDTMSKRQQTGATVDGLETGAVDTIVTGIVTAFSASQRMIAQAAAWGANVLIVHEGLFYSHHDQHELLHADPVYRQKLALIQQTDMHIIRVHDVIHREQPDGIMEGLLERLQWRSLVVEETATWAIVELDQAQALNDLAVSLKQQLKARYIRLSGKAEQRCQRIGLLVGYRGGATLGLPLLGRDDVDVLIAGEGPEWELPEYVRDAVEQGRMKALMMVGHAESEQPGMEWLAERLRKRYEGIAVHDVANEPVFWIV
ncbi:Nif3-like dinuclear metal center hexameric protein [Paenibacillus sp. SGZ-1009]|uniref:Nif3-like dinuclear metal center hexameric protein n=1 Tax=Paenibacillus campi TaxID=3106031 RepID=UPI002AFEFB43|nr:Nif3-like dinuclear metal center hexameric protein [Paenibacillus sp. SGZ-1009]